MKTNSKHIFTTMAAIMMLGIVGCSTTKHEPAPAAPEPVVEPQPAPAPAPAPEPAPEPEPVLEPKPDRG